MNERNAFEVVQMIADEHGRDRLPAAVEHIVAETDKMLAEAGRSPAARKVCVKYIRALFEAAVEAFEEIEAIEPGASSLSVH